LTVTFVAMPGVDAIRSFRALLKAAGRHYGLRAVSVRECALTHVEDERARVFPSHPPRSTREIPMSAFSERIRSQTKGFYKVADLEGGREVTHTIKHLDEAMEMFGKTMDILNFSDTGRQLNVNQTNAEWLLNNLGNNPEQWAGQKVTLYLAEYEYGEKKGQTIRLKLPGTTSKPAAPQGDGASKTPTRSASRKDDFDDSIPF
jgi:hypothetical protein